ncbi:hypothetical protein MY11210_003295 [Beauveria gryllotalpidicola]
MTKLANLSHHRAETPTLRQTTPSSAPSHIDATPEPAPEYLIRVPYSATRPGEPSKYERKPRRKTRPDRYDTSHQHRERKTLSRRERREEKRNKLRLRKEIVANFYSAATENRQVLVIRPRLAGGTMIFRRLTQRIDETGLGDRGFCKRSRLRFNSAPRLGQRRRNFQMAPVNDPVCSKEHVRSRLIKYQQIHVLSLKGAQILLPQGQDNTVGNGPDSGGGRVTKASLIKR